MSDLMSCEHTEPESVYFFKMGLAGLNIEVECSAGKYYSHCIPYLAKFNHADFVVRVEKETILKRYSILRTGNPDAIDYEENTELGAIEAELVYEKIAAKAIDFDTILIHGAVVAKDDNAIMFSGPSGIGKSTRAKIWLDEYPGSIIINGDKPLIRISGNSILACGTPWCGKEGWNTNAMVPLRAIFFIERADADEESLVEELNMRLAMPFLLRQTYSPWGNDSLFKIIHLLERLDGRVKFFKFHSAPTPKAIHIAYKTIFQR